MLKKMIHLLTLCLLVFTPFMGEASDKPFVILGCRNSGMFSIFCNVLALVKYYDQGYYRGIEVNFEDKGLYYIPSLGKNWWNYYCEPISLGEKRKVKYVRSTPPFSKPWEAFKHTSREEAFALIQKYIHLKPHIQNKVDNFEKVHFMNYFAICVHYRGTDKRPDSLQDSYERIVREILNVMKKNGDLKYKIFVATDEQPFLDYMIGLFGNKVCFYEDALRSTDGKPLHISLNYDHYKNGEDALIDCVLLSRGNILIRPDSNLSRWSEFFNPNIPVKLLD